jgi:hypothetical protein
VVMTPYCSLVRGYDTVLQSGAWLWHRIAVWCVVMTPCCSLVRGYDTVLQSGAWLWQRIAVCCVVMASYYSLLRGYQRFGRKFYLPGNIFAEVGKLRFSVRLVLIYQNSEPCVISKNAIMRDLTWYITSDFSSFSV